MRWGRGSFRLWVAATALWAAAAGVIAADAYLGGRLPPREYQFAPQLRPTATLPVSWDWRFYDLAFPPLRGPRPEAFPRIDSLDLRDFEAALRNGLAVRLVMSDGTALFVHGDITAADRD